MFIVLDTNILVSALLSREGKPAWVVREIMAKRFKPCFDDRIISEYTEVLHRPKFNLHPLLVDCFIAWYVSQGISVVAPPIPDNIFQRDPDDKPFYEVAKFTGATLITGNLKHFPDDPQIVSLAEFYERNSN